MTTANGRNEFAPPPTPGFLRALGLAILAHGLLVAMLTLGVQWKREATPVTVEAELWSAVPEQAAPPAPEQPIPAEPVPAPVPPEPVAPPKSAAPPPPVVSPDADIAIAKEKARLKKEKLLQQEKLEEQKKQKLQQDKLQKEKLEREKEKLDKAARDKKLQQNQRDQQAKADEAAKQKAAAASKEDAKKLEQLRQQNMKRMAGLAGSGVSGNGDAKSTGTAAQSSGPSAGYSGRIRARIKPNITYTESITGNPTAEVEVRTSPDGTIISRKLTQSSGVKSWDVAVLNAIDKTEVLPRDVDGRVPSSLVISFRPKD
jgi:colicin import membrane protein